MKLGATGEFPQGPLGPEDAGEIVLAVAADREKGVVLVDFGTPVVWLGLPVKEARGLATMLLTKAAELEVPAGEGGP